MVGLRLRPARRAILRRHCRIGRISHARSKRARGLVIAQSPRRGVYRPRGTRVRMVVSRGRRVRK